MDQFAISVLPRPEVINAWIVTGEVDIVLNVMTRTVGEYEQILGLGLTHLKTVLDRVDQADATATLLLAADPFSDSQQEMPHAVPA